MFRSIDESILPPNTIAPLCLNSEPPSYQDPKVMKRRLMVLKQYKYPANYIKNEQAASACSFIINIRLSLRYSFDILAYS